MQLVLMMAGALLGVVCYRLGRREGEAGRVLPLFPRRQKKRREDELLDKIEGYKGRRE